MTFPRVCTGVGGSTAIQLRVEEENQRSQELLIRGNQAWAGRVAQASWGAGATELELGRGWQSIRFGWLGRSRAGASGWVGDGLGQQAEAAAL